MFSKQTVLVKPGSFSSMGSSCEQGAYQLCKLDTMSKFALL